MTEPQDTPDKGARERATATISKAREEEATFEGLMAKPRRSNEFTVTVPAEDGGVRKLKCKVRALDPNVYDELIESHPPRKSEKVKGAFYNKDTFPPALISATFVTPKLSVEQATDLWNNPDWAPGELAELFTQAQMVNGAGLDVPFNGSA